MLTINTTKTDSTLTVSVSGRLDTLSSPDLDNRLKEELDGVQELIFDLQGLTYISSAGLRVLLSAQKVMNRQGSMVIRNASDTIKEIFDVTGFSDIMTVE